MYLTFLYRFLKDDRFICSVWVVFWPFKKKMCEQLQVTTTPIYSIIIYFNQILSSHQPHTLSLIY